jgi:hypothetical protein
MKKTILILLAVFGLALVQSKDKDKYFYYFFSEQDVTELKSDLEKKGMAYKPMYIIMEKDTLEITQITENNQPYRNTNPKLICMGIPEDYDYTSGGVFIHFKKYKKLNEK